MNTPGPDLIFSFSHEILPPIVVLRYWFSSYLGRKNVTYQSTNLCYLWHLNSVLVLAMSGLVKSDTVIARGGKFAVLKGWKLLPL